MPEKTELGRFNVSNPPLDACQEFRSSVMSASLSKNDRLSVASYALLPYKRVVVAPLIDVTFFVGYCPGV